jgi:hypothetical protein
MFTFHRVLLFSFLLILSSSISYSQNYLQLFSGYIPDAITKNDDFKKQVDVNIGNYASVNPDLVYYYIMYINKRFGEKIISADSNYYNLLREKDHEYRILRNEWVKNEMLGADEIEPGILSTAVKNNLSDIFWKDEVKYRDTLKILTVDVKLQAYFAYLIVTGIKAEYNSETDYSSGIIKGLKEKSEYFENEFASSGDIDQAKRYELIEAALNFSYLFNNGYLDKYRQDTDIHLYRFLYGMMVDDFTQRNSLRAGVLYLRDNFKRESELIFKETPFPYFHLENKAVVKINSGLWGEVGIRLATREYKTPFSYLELDAGYVLITDIKIDDDIKSQVIHWDSYQPSTGKHAYITYTINKNNDTKHFAVYGHISTPVYFFLKNLYVDAGLYYLYTSVKVNYYDINRKIDSLISNDPADFQEYTKNYSDKYTRSSIFPSLGVNYTLFDLINVKVEYLIPNLLTAKAEFIYYL